MQKFPSALRIYLAVEPVDMRKQFNGLWSLAEEKLQENRKRPSRDLLLKPEGKA